MSINNVGQTMVEALFVVVFTTIIMFAFLQICIMVVDDMTANEAAFVAVRSAAVTGNGNESQKQLYQARLEEAKWRVSHYFNSYYYLFSETSSLKEWVLNKTSKRSFHFSNLEEVGAYYGDRNNNNNQEQSYEEDGEVRGNPVTVWPEKPDQMQKYTKDYSGGSLSKMTVKIYYYTRVMFGSLVAKKTSNVGERSEWTDRNIFKIGGNRRYQSARSRMVPSPDSSFYYKAYPEAKRFDEE